MDATIRRYSLWMLFVFVVSILWGVLGAREFPEMAHELVTLVEEQIAPISELSLLLLFIAILVNNALKTFLMMLSGFLFGIMMFWGGCRRSHRCMTKSSEGLKGIKLFSEKKKKKKKRRNKKK